MSFTRRDFLKASAAASALAGLGLPSDVLAAQGERWVKSVCRYCGTGCGLYVGVRDGKVFAVKGDRDNHNRGLLCLKGFLLPQIMTAPDRCLHPLVRKGGQARPGELGRGDRRSSRARFRGGDRGRTARTRSASTAPARGSPRRPTPRTSSSRRAPHEQRGGEPAPLHGVRRRRLRHAPSARTSRWAATRTSTTPTSCSSSARTPPRRTRSCSSAWRAGSRPART